MRKSSVLPNDLQEHYLVEKEKYQHSCQALTGTPGKSENQHMLASLGQVISWIASVSFLVTGVSPARLFEHENVGVGESVLVKSILLQFPLVILKLHAESIAKSLTSLWLCSDI